MDIKKVQLSKSEREELTKLSEQYEMTDVELLTLATKIGLSWLHLLKNKELDTLNPQKTKER